ncbi:hypothetical protein F4824DRAFT_489000 [Ustulina deusta]|nr:hypothetical protein F4824DRAFT_489000 [Ustulina deusta]
MTGCVSYVSICRRTERREALLSNYRDGESYDEKSYLRPRLSSRFPLFNLLVISLLLTSLAINAAQLFLSFRPATPINYEEPPSKYAHLSHTHEEPYVLTEYATANKTNITKGLYILHSIHNLYYLKNIYISLRKYRCGIVCDADDTPRATDRRPEVVAGLEYHRMCRSWDALEDFAKRHTACYKRPENAERDGPKKLDRFKHCPPGSGYVVTDD